MPDNICTQISNASKTRIKELIKTARETKENQNAFVENGKITSVVSGGRPAHRIAGDGKGIVYAPAPKMEVSERTTRIARQTSSVLQHSRPSHLDLIEMVKHNRPFTCRAQKLADVVLSGSIKTGEGLTRGAKTVLACYTPNDFGFPMAEEFIEATDDSITEWKKSLEYWIQYGDPPVEHDQNLFEGAMRRELNWRRMKANEILTEFANEALDTCKVGL